MTFTPLGHTPYPWYNGQAGGTPVSATNLMAAETDAIAYAQQDDLAVVNYFESVVLTFNLINSGAVGGASSSATLTADHTALIQAYINEASTAAQAISNFAVSVIDCPELYYRVQNLVLPGNVALRANGTVFQYVASGLAPPSGYGNYVITCYGNHNQIKNLVILGGGATQAGVGGIWCMPANVNGGSNARSYKNIFEDVKINNFGHRGYFDQGVNNIWTRGLVENVLLAQTSAPYFLGAFESAGSDMMLSDAELTPSVTTGNGQVLGGIPVPRSPSIFLQSSITTTNGSISLPLSNGTITLTSTTAFPATGGAVIINGTLIAFGTVSGSTLTGCYSGGTGTITTGTNVYAPIGFCCSLVLGGVADWVSNTDAEIGDVSVFLGPSMLAMSLTSTTINQTPQTITVDSTNHINPAGGSLQLVNNQNNTWSATTINYTSTSGGNSINGVTIPSSTISLTSGQALLNIQLPTQTHTSMLRGDLSMTHAWIVGPGGGRHSGAEALRAAVTMDATYYGFYAPSGSGSNWDFMTPTADSSSVTNAFQYAITDQNVSGSNYNRWTFPRPLSCHNTYFTGNTAGGWFTLADSPGVALGSGATPSVKDNTAFIDQNGGATSITNFIGGVNGQEFTLIQGVNTTITNNANIVTKSGSNISPPGAGYVALRFKKIGYGTTPTPAWYQI